jgi:hypothetical protein
MEKVQNPVILRLNGISTYEAVLPEWSWHEGTLSKEHTLSQCTNIDVSTVLYIYDPSQLSRPVIIIMTRGSTCDNWLVMICVFIIIASWRFGTCEKGRTHTQTSLRNSFNENTPWKPQTGKS